MNDHEINVVELYVHGIGWIEVMDPIRLRIGTRTVSELRQHGINPERWKRKKTTTPTARTLPEHTLKLKSIKDMERMIKAGKNQ